MNQMISGSMMGGIGFVELLVLIALILSMVALCKYILFGKKINILGPRVYSSSIKKYQNH